MAMVKFVYMPAFSDMLIEHMERGFSYNTFYATIKVPKAVVDGWLESEVEFKEAKAQGTGRRRKHLEQLLLGKIIALDVYKHLLADEAVAEEEAMENFSDGILIQAKERFQC
jgi:hypothetical protein